MADDELLEQFIDLIGGVATMLDYCESGDKAQARDAAKKTAAYATKVEQRIAELEIFG